MIRWTCSCAVWVTRRFFFSLPFFYPRCFIPAQKEVSALCVCTQSPGGDLKLKLYEFSFTNVPSLAESRVQLWMNSHNILAAVYLGFCSLCWLASTERQTKHSGGCQLMFFFFPLYNTDSLIKLSQPLQRWFTEMRIKILIPWIEDGSKYSSEITWVSTCFSSCQDSALIKTSFWGFSRSPKREGGRFDFH